MNIIEIIMTEITLASFTDIRDAERFSKAGLTKLAFAATLKDFFPRNLVISYQRLSNICESYQLDPWIYLEDYQGEIPEKNLVELEDFVEAERKTKQFFKHNPHYHIAHSPKIGSIIYYAAHSYRSFLVIVTFWSSQSSSSIED